MEYALPEIINFIKQMSLFVQGTHINWRRVLIGWKLISSIVSSEG